MKYLKLFDIESDYKAYRDGAVGGGGYIQPNVSLCDDNGNVYYNYPSITMTNGYPYMNLGLPSGTLWSTMNVGASKPSDYGQYFQWGDTSGYTVEQIGNGDGQKKFAKDYSDYKWGAKPFFTKYTTVKATLTLEDDAAHVNMGGSWHMPSPEQINELIDNTISTWTTLDGVNGRLFTSRKDASKFIFIPSAGGAWEGSVYDSGSCCGVLSTMLSSYRVDFMQYIYFRSNLVSLHTNGDRYIGYSVRGVIG